MSAHRPVTHFAARLGYRFRKLEGLEEALTHGSYRNGREASDYERLEFLGDAALGLVVTETMHSEQPSWSAQRRQETKGQIVSNQSLATAARALGLDEGIRVGPGRSAGTEVRSSDRILANVFEAVLGAAYLDGGMAAARGVVGAAFSRRLRSLRLAAPKRRPGLIAEGGALRALGRLLMRLARRLAFRRSPKERALGHTFAWPGLLAKAVDPAPETPAGPGRGRGRRRRPRGGGRRERRAATRSTGRPALRFLGRDVMHLLTAEALHRAFPAWDEGRMTLARMRLQQHQFTDRLGERWQLGPGDTATGDAEAVLGALFLDGGLAAARRSLRAPFAEALDDLAEPGLELLDPKTLLQNRLAKDGKDAPRYDLRRNSGKRNQEVVVALRVGDGTVETGRGRGLKEAEKDAAQRAFDRLYGNPPRKRPSRARPAARGASAPAGGGRQGRQRPVPKQKSAAAGNGPGALPAIGTDPKENPKGALQEVLVKRDGRMPVYRLISESGPEHDKTFVVEVLRGQQTLGRGTGGSKRKAEAEAARAALAAGFRVR